MGDPPAPWPRGLREIEANLPFLPLARMGLLVCCCCCCCSGLLAPLGSGGGCACSGACLPFFGVVVVVAVVDFVILFTVTVVLSFATVMWRLVELRFWWPEEEVDACCCCCRLVSLGDLRGPTAAGGLEEREWTSLRKGLAGDGARFSLFFSSGLVVVVVVSVPEPLEGLSILYYIIHRQQQHTRRETEGDDKHDESTATLPQWKNVRRCRRCSSAAPVEIKPRVTAAVRTRILRLVTHSIASPACTRLSLESPLVVSRRQSLRGEPT